MHILEEPLRAELRVSGEDPIEVWKPVLIMGFPEPSSDQTALVCREDGSLDVARYTFLRLDWRYSWEKRKWIDNFYEEDDNGAPSASAD